LERPDERLVDVVGNEADEARITPFQWREVQKAYEKARKKQIHDTIQEIKNILKDRDLELIGRIELKDIRTNKKYK